MTAGPAGLPFPSSRAAGDTREAEAIQCVHSRPSGREGGPGNPGRESVCPSQSPAPRVAPASLVASLLFVAILCCPCALAWASFSAARHLSAPWPLLSVVSLPLLPGICSALAPPCLPSALFPRPLCRLLVPASPGLHFLGAAPTHILRAPPLPLPGCSQGILDKLLCAEAPVLLTAPEECKGRHGYKDKFGSSFAEEICGLRVKLKQKPCQVW